jgi:hypothetical protein
VSYLHDFLNSLLAAENGDLVDLLMNGRDHCHREKVSGTLKVSTCNWALLQCHSTMQVCWKFEFKND